LPASHSHSSPAIRTFPAHPAAWPGFLLSYFEQMKSNLRRQRYDRTRAGKAWGVVPQDATRAEQEKRGKWHGAVAK